MFVGIARLARCGELLEEKARIDYRTLPSRQLLNRCSARRMPFTWTINPYRGCEFGCKYCYARYTHEFMELREPQDFETKIFSKQWDADSFRGELRRVKRGESIAIGTATDPYQPAERRFEMTRRVLEVVAGRKGLDLHITTKSDLVTRDLALLCEIGRSNSIGVHITITTVDAGLARRLEPLAPHPNLRLAAVRILTDAGIPVGILAHPALPNLTDSMASLLEVAKAGREQGAASFSSAPLFLKPCAYQVMLPFLEEQFPDLAKRYRKLFARGAFLNAEYRRRLSATVREVRRLAGYPERDFEYVPIEEEQLSLFGGSG